MYETEACNIEYSHSNKVRHRALDMYQRLWYVSDVSDAQLYLLKFASHPPPLTPVSGMKLVCFTGLHQPSPLLFSFVLVVHASLNPSKYII